MVAAVDRPDKSSAQRRQEAEFWSEQVIREIHDKLLDWARKILIVVGLPFAIVIFTKELISTETPWLVILELATIAVVMGVVIGPFSLRVRAVVITCGLGVFAVGTLLAFGPLLGSGARFVMVSFIATVFFGRRGLLVSSILLAVLLVVVVVGNERGWLSTPYAPDSLWVWTRLSSATLFTTIIASLLFLQTQGLLRASLVREAAARSFAEEAEEFKEKTMRAAMVSQRLESLGRLAGGVAHEFNNALVVATSNMEMLDDPGHLADRAELVREIHQSLERAGAMSQQLLTFAKGDAGSQGECQPRQLMATMQSSLALFFPASIEVQFRLEGDRSIAMPGPLLEQTLMNLMHNARDAMPGGGQLLLECVDSPDRSEVIVAVQDSGPGIDASIRSQIFEPFFSTRGSTGTGLGLSMVWGSVTRHHGSVSLDDTVEQGARFELRFPVVETKAPSVEDTSNDYASVAMRILVLEDEELVGKIFERILTREGHEVVMVVTAKDGLEAMLDGSYDMLISDAIVPGGGVGEFILRFRERFPGHAILVCSGYAEDETLLGGVDVGDFEFLAKPFAPVDLKRAIAAARARATRAALPLALPRS